MYHVITTLLCINVQVTALVNKRDFTALVINLRNNVPIQPWPFFLFQA